MLIKKIIWSTLVIEGGLPVSHVGEDAAA